MSLARVVEVNYVSREPTRLIIVDNGEEHYYPVTSCNPIGEGSWIIWANNQRFIGRREEQTWILAEWPIVPRQLTLF